MGYYLALKKKVFQKRTFANVTTWMGIEDIRLSQTSQTQNNKYA